MLKKRTHTKRKAQNKQNLVAFAWRNPVPDSEPNPNLRFPAVRERLPGGPLLLLPLTDNRSDWHTQRMSVQVRHESGSTLSGWACSWWRVTRHDGASSPSRYVALHVKFSSLRWKFKLKEMQIRMWMRLRLWLLIWVRSGLCGTHLIMIHHSAKRGDEGTGTLLLFRCLLERLLRLL